MCSELNLCKRNTTKPLAFPLAKSEPLTNPGVRKHTAFHFSLKRNVYLNQINIQRETLDLCYFAYRSCCLHSYAFPQRDTFVSSFVSYNKDRGKTHSCFEKQQVITSFQGIKPNKTPFFLSNASRRKEKKSSKNTYYSTALHHLQTLSSFLLHPHFMILGGRPPKTSKCLFYKT